MAWVRIDDSFPDHPKALQAGPLACWLYVCGIAYANRHLTDGFIPARQVSRLIDAKKADALAAALVEAELWEAVDGGYQVHDYLDYQPSAEKVKKERSDNAERQARYRERHAVSNAESNGVTAPLVTPSVTPAPITTQCNNLTVGAAAPKSTLTALPKNGPAQSIVAAWYERAGGKPVNYGKAVGLGQKLADLGATERDVGDLYDWMGEQDFFAGKFDFGTAVTQYEKFQQSKKPRRMTASRSGVMA